MPVTHGVAGSSPVRTAKALKMRAFSILCHSIIIYCIQKIATFIIKDILRIISADFQSIIQVNAIILTANDH